MVARTLRHNEKGNRVKAPSKIGGFETLLMEAADEGLMEMGESIKRAIYLHLEVNSSLRKEDIPRKLKAFTVANRKVFGQGGKVIERLILQRLCEKLRFDYDRIKNDEFPEALAKIRKASRATERCTVFP